MTRTVRGIPTEVMLRRAEGLDVDRVATIDNTFAIAKSLLTRRMGALAGGRFDLDVCVILTAVAR